MFVKKGFTIIEILVVLVIVGILAALVISNLIPIIEQSKAQTARNNLMAISAAESKYYEDHSSYCLNSNPACADNNTDLNTNLLLTIASDDPFTYVCTSAAPPEYYQCKANDNTDMLILDVTPQGGAVVTCSGPNNNKGYCPS